MTKTSQGVSNHVQKLFRIECHFCGMKQEVDHLESDGTDGAASFLSDGGWREVTSNKFNVIAAACPECAKSKDKDR